VDLRNLEGLKDHFGRTLAARKLDLLLRLERSTLPSASAVARLYDLLCYWRAYPETEEVLSCVERMLEAFDRRSDLKRERSALIDTGISGTETYFRFYWLMAIRLVERWPDRLTIDRGDFEHASKLAGMFHLLMPYTETPGLDAFDLPARDWIRRFKNPSETDAAFLIRRFKALPVPLHTREFLYEMLDVPIRIVPGPGTPARGREKWPGSPVVFQKRAPSRSRPPLRTIIRKARFKVRHLRPTEARRLIDLANAIMIPRHRDLLLFLHGSEDDVRMIDFGDGLEFACIGAKPDRRLVLEAVYAFLTLKNGVPLGYILNSALFRSCELAYNVFDTFRGSEAALVYGRFLATVHRLFGADSFTVDPYQLGFMNREGQRSGAWWFYYKYGFRPRNPEILQLVREELRRIRKDRSYRTSPSRLNRLASDNMYFSLGRSREDVLGQISLGQIGLRISRSLAERFGSDREKGLRVCSREAASLLGVRSLERFSPGERVAWNRWSPLVLALPGIERWSARSKRALAAVVRAKGGRRETEFVRLFDGHAPLRRALLELAKEE
jgi:hypothetical protein